MWDAIQPWLVSAIGGCFGALFLLPTKLGEAVLKFRFDKLLEAAKTDSNRDIEQLREKLSHLSDRGKRSNELEFAAVQTVWDKLMEAYLSVGAAVYSFIEFPDLSGLKDEELRSYLATVDFTDQQIKQVTDATDRKDAYVKVIMWRSIAKAINDVFEVRLLLRKQRIFMQDNLREQFQAVIDLMNSAAIERKLNVQHPHIPQKEWGGNALKYSKEIDGMVDALAAAVNARLFRADPVPLAERDR